MSFRPLPQITPTTTDQIEICKWIRAASFVASGDPLQEEFDEHDRQSSTHLIATAGNDAVGTMRVRFLCMSPSGGETFLERFAVLPAARGSLRVLNALAAAALQYSRFKGVTRVSGAVSDMRLQMFWRRRGYRFLDRPPEVYNGVEYYLMSQTFPVARRPPEWFGGAALFRSESEQFEVFRKGQGS